MLSDTEKIALITKYRDKYLSRFVEDPSLEWVSLVLDGYEEGQHGF